MATTIEVDGQYHNNSARGGRGGCSNTAGTPGQGRGHDQGTDYIPQVVLDSLTPQQRRCMLQGRNMLRQADIANPLVWRTTRHCIQYSCRTHVLPN